MNHKNKIFSSILLMFLIIISYLFLFPLLIGSIINCLAINNDKIKELIYFSGYFLMALIYAYIFKNDLIDQWKIFRKDYRNCLKEGLKYWIIGFFLMILFNITAYYIDSSLSANEQGNRELLMLFPLLQSLSVLILAPFNEEIIFRLNIRKTFENNLMFYFTSALFFGAIHMMSGINGFVDIFHFLAYAVFGLSFALSLSKTKTLFTPLAFHMIHNLIGLIIIFIS